MPLAAVISPDVIFANFVKELFDNKENYQDDSYRRDALERAVSTAIKEMNFAQVMDLFHQNHPQIIDLFTSITRRAPNISNLQIMEGLLPEGNASCISMDAAMVSAIGRMTNLKILKVNRFSLSLSELMGLCRNLPSLKVLYFKIEPESDVDIDNFEQSFGNLEIFRFSPASNDLGLNYQYRRMLTLECISCLPNLRFLGDPDDENFVDMLPTCLEIAEVTGDEWNSKLTHLMLFLAEDVAEDALKKFSNVQQLHILCGFSPIDNYDIAGLLKFQQLSNLVLIDLNDMGFLEKLLSSNGVLLKHLLLSFKPHYLLVDSLIEICFLIFVRCSARLNRLILRNIDSSLPSHIEQRPVLPSCNSLQELELEFIANCTHRDSYIFISEYLHARNLEKVRLIRVSTTVEELERTATLVKWRNILTRVTHFELHLIENDSINNENRHATQACGNIERNLRASRRDDQQGEWLD